MSNPSCGPADQQNVVPTDSISYPDVAALQGYGVPASVITSRLPGRDGAITTLVLGMVLMVFIVPIVLFATMIVGVASTDGDAAKGDTTASGGVVTVTAGGIFMVRANAHKDPSCSSIGADDKSYELEPYVDSEDVYLAENLPAGSYVLQYDGIASDANITAFNASPEVVTKVFTMPFVWGIVADVVDLILLIVGIVLLVKVNGKRHRITQESILSAVR